MLCEICYNDEFVIGDPGNDKQPKSIKLDTDNLLFPGSEGSLTLNKHLRVYFIVTRLLKIPGTEFPKLLESRRTKIIGDIVNADDNGNTETLLYGALCAKCESIVDEAVTLHQNVLKLQKTIDKLGERLFELNEIGQQRQKKKQQQSSNKKVNLSSQPKSYKKDTNVNVARDMLDLSLHCLGSVVIATKDIKSAKKIKKRSIKESLRPRKTAPSGGVNAKVGDSTLSLSSVSHWKEREPLESVSKSFPMVNSLCGISTTDAYVKEEVVDCEETTLALPFSQFQDNSTELELQIVEDVRDDPEDDFDYVPTESSDEEMNTNDDDDYEPENAKKKKIATKNIKAAISDRDESESSEANSSNEDDDMEEESVLVNDTAVEINFGRSNFSGPSFVHQCPECLKVCSSQVALHMHTKNAHGIKTFYTCPKCPDLQFRLRKEFVDHRNTAHGNICEKCGKRLSKIDQLIDHYRRVHKMTFTFTCPLCKMEFKTRLELRTHRSKVHVVSKEARARLPERPPRTEDEAFWTGKPCSECGRTYLSGRKLANHLKEKHEYKLPKGQRKKLKKKCYFCHKYFCLEQSHWVHRMLDHPDKKLEFHCEQCSKGDDPVIFQTIPELLAHFERVHASESVHTCVWCQWPFLDKTSHKAHLNGHMNKHEDPDIKDAKKIEVCKFNCWFCWDMFPNDDQLQRHLKVNTRHRKPPLKVEFPCDDNQCEFSEKPFSTVADLRCHLETSHSDKEVFTCDRCSWSFLSRDMLEVHSMNHVRRRAGQFKCPSCDHIATILPALRDHFNTRHGVSLLLYKCPICDDRFPSRRGVIVHKRQKHDRYSEVLAKEGLPCDQCGKMMSNETALKNHQSSVHSSAPCSDCPMVFTSVSKLNYHRKRAHGYGETYLCNVCGKVFHERTTLVNHMTFHKGKRYECHRCGKKMLTLEKLKVHLKKFHEQKKPTGPPKKFVCGECGAGYSRKDSLDDHVRRQHTNETHRVWSCEKCGKRFIRPGNLKEHLNGRKGCTTRVTIDEAMREEKLQN